MIKQALEHFRIPFGNDTAERLETFVNELIRWNEKINLVGIKDKDQVCRELLADAFYLESFAREISVLVDIGSGSGILGFPLSVLNESMTVFSVDSNLKKIQFQRHICRTFRTDNFRPVHGRIESITPIGADGIICKAYGDQNAIFMAADRHLLPGGRIIAPKGKNETPVDHEAYSLEINKLYCLPGVEKEFRLLVYKKIS